MSTLFALVILHVCTVCGILRYMCLALAHQLSKSREREVWCILKARRTGAPVPFLKTSPSPEASVIDTEPAPGHTFLQGPLHRNTETAMLTNDKYSFVSNNL